MNRIIVDNKIGNKVFFLCEPDDIYEDGEVMQFSLLKDSKIEVGSITVDEDGIHYFTRSESEIFPENGLFFSEEEGDAFIAEHCGEFNSLKIKHGDPIYHHFITDHIESARFSCECKDIIIRTKMVINFYGEVWGKNSRSQNRIQRRRFAMLLFMIIMRTPAQDSLKSLVCFPILSPQQRC